MGGEENISAGDKTVPVYRERGPDFEIFRELTRRLNEKDSLIKAQSVELASKFEEMLRHEARIALLLDCCPLGVIFICNRIIEYANKRIGSITGYDPEELVGKNSLFLYETVEEWDTVGKTQQSTGRSKSVNVKFKRKNGEFAPCKLQMTRVIDDFDHEFIVLVYSDI